MTTTGRSAGSPRSATSLGFDEITEGTMRNVVNGIDPMRRGRIRLICRVTAKYGDGIAYEQLVADDAAK